MKFLYYATTMLMLYFCFSLSEIIPLVNINADSTHTNTIFSELRHENASSMQKVNDSAYKNSALGVLVTLSAGLITIIPTIFLTLCTGLPTIIIGIALFSSYHRIKNRTDNRYPSRIQTHTVKQETPSDEYTPIHKYLLKGTIFEYSLYDIFQLLELNRKTGFLYIENSDNRVCGTIFFKNGIITFAQLGKLIGIEAILKILNLYTGHYEFVANSLSMYSNCENIIPAEIMLHIIKIKDEEAYYNTEAVPTVAR